MLVHSISSEGFLSKNKMFVKDYKNLMKTLTNAKSLTEKHEKPMLSEDMLSHLQQMIQHLENQSTEYKCCLYRQLARLFVTDLHAYVDMQRLFTHKS